MQWWHDLWMSLYPVHVTVSLLPDTTDHLIVCSGIIVPSGRRVHDVMLMLPGCSLGYWLGDLNGYHDAIYFVTSWQASRIYGVVTSPHRQCCPFSYQTPICHAAHWASHFPSDSCKIEVSLNHSMWIGGQGVHPGRNLERWRRVGSY